MSKSLSCSLAALLLALGLGGQFLHADTCQPAAVWKRVTTYECVVTHETRREPYQQVVTKYDACGRPYTVVVTCSRDVQVPVKKVVAVTRWVKVAG